MKNKPLVEQIDPNDDLEYVPRIKNVPQKSHDKKINRKLLPAVLVDAGISEEMDPAKFTYKASRYEKGWLIDSLSSFYELHWFHDILRLVKGGKEASVYLCANNQTNVSPYMAAKVYRPRQFRALRNDHIYQEGRARLDASGNTITNSGLNHAMNKRTEFGVELLHISWIEHEYKTLQLLHTAGCDVPLVFAKNNNAILMSYIGDEETGAPTLNDVELPKNRARLLFDQIIHNIDLMLSCNRIHGDLSAFNILYWEGVITIIDFPQAIHPQQNPNALHIFKRDVQRICDYFSRQGIQSNPLDIANNLWRKYGHEITPKVHPAYLNPEDEKDREIWDHQSA